MITENATTILHDNELKQELQRRAAEAGFLQARVSGPAVGGAHQEKLHQWLANGMHGEMQYMARHARHDADVVVTGAKSVIVFAASYWSAETETDPDEPHVRIARYARGKDYHVVLRERLEPIVEWLREVRPGHEWRICVDSPPLLERAFAEQSGIGFVGRNTMLITRGAGSYYFLAEIVTTAEIEPDTPITGTCGTCTRCIDACPTQAIVAPYELDARRCISYLTIERKTELSKNESAAIREWAFGCDICQEVCPYNKSPVDAVMDEFAHPRLAGNEPLSTFTEPQSNSQFEKRLADSPVMRPGRKRVQANARSAAVNRKSIIS